MNDYNGTGKELQLKYVKNVNMLPAQWREEKERMVTKAFTKRKGGKKGVSPSINKQMFECLQYALDFDSVEKHKIKTKRICGEILNLS